MSDEERARRQAVQLLDRYGIVARELYRREELLPWALIASELQRMEMRGEIRRGYFVEGLSGMQFGLPSAVEELRRLHSGTSSASVPLLVNACDPANPFGPGIPLPQEASAGEPRLVRVPSNYVVFHRGTPLLFVENYGLRLWTLAEATEENMKNSLRIFLGVLQLPEQIRPVKAVRVEHCDGIRPAQHRFAPVLRDLGFTRDRNQTMVYERYV
jgi:ATP-dependent Lhr-like helicase